MGSHGPFHGFLLCAHSDIQQFWLFLVSGFPQLDFDIADIFEVVVFDRLCLDSYLHLSKFWLHLVKSVSKILFLTVLRFNISELGGRFLHCLSDVLVLLHSHSNGLILEGQWVFVGLLTLSQKAVHLSAMLIVLCTDRFYLLDQSVSDIFIEVLNVEILILFIEIKEQLLFVLNFLVDSQECWNFLREDMHQVLIGQVFEQNLGSFSAIFCEPIEDTCDFLSSNIGLLLCVIDVIRLIYLTL